MVEQAYSLIFRKLRERIAAGEYPPGHRLPPERELTAQFGVSRITLRHALRLLQEQGLVERHRGRGTFVRPPARRKIPLVYTDFANSVRNEAPQMRREILADETAVPPPPVAALFGFVRGETCRHAMRLDWLFEEPLAYDHAYLVPEASSKTDGALLSRIDFYDRWIEREGLAVGYGEQTVEAAAADREAAEYLRVRRGTPILLTWETIHAPGGAVLAVFLSYYRGDRFKLVSTTTTKGAPHARSAH